MDFRDKVVIVTGSSAGIGAAVVQRFLAEGAYVVINARRPDKLMEFASLLPQDRVLLQAGDVSNIGQAQDLISAAAARFGKIDVLVNNASEFKYADLASHPDDVWRQSFATNVDAAFYTCRAALPFLAAEKGSIVNVSTVQALGGDVSMSAYNASKGALSNYTRALAVELAPQGIRVNAVLPAFVWTERTSVLRGNQEIISRQVERFPLRRVAEAEEIAAAVAFLASDDASYITGVNLPVDGGLMATSGLASFL